MLFESYLNFTKHHPSSACLQPWNIGQFHQVPDGTTHVPTSATLHLVFSLLRTLLLQKCIVTLLRSLLKCHFGTHPAPVISVPCPTLFSYATFYN